MIVASFLAVALYFFPLFRIVPLAKTAAVPATAFDPASSAAKFWREQLPPAVAQAQELAPVLTALRRDPAAAVKRYAHQVGLGGTAYYFVRGTGRIVAVEKNQILVAV